MRVHKPICSNGDYYTEDKDYQTSCGGNSRSKNNPLLSKLEYLINQDMKLNKINPTSIPEINAYWKDRL